MESLVFLLGIYTLGTWVLTRLLGPFATALARRLVEGRRGSAGFDPEEFQREIEGLHDRVDFLERALASRADPSAGGLQPRSDEAHEADYRVATPV